MKTQQLKIQSQKPDRFTKFLVKDFQNFESQKVSPQSLIINDEIVSEFINILEMKLLNDSLPKEEMVRLMKLTSSLKWEKEKNGLATKNIEEQIIVAAQLHKKSQSGFEQK
jgi:hypothetical protein